jgi:hypothetical protein
MFNFASTKDGQRQIALIGLQEVETANNVLNTATNVGAVLAPEPYTKGGFLLANTVSDATAIGIDVAQCSLNPSTENAADIGVSTGGLLLGKVFGNMLNKWFGALSPTSKNPNQFRDITTGQFSKTSTGKIGQNLDAGVGQVINIAQDKVTK